jgi:hypothetical protein
MRTPRRPAVSPEAPEGEGEGGISLAAEAAILVLFERYERLRRRSSELTEYASK